MGSIALPKPLLKRWHLALAVSIAACAAVAAAVSPALGGEAVMLRAGLVFAGAAWLLASCRLHLRDNRGPGGALYESLGPANRLTLARGLAVAALAAFYLTPGRGGFVDWLPALLYAAVVAGDYLDGLIARRSARLTRLGERLDTEVDALGVLFASALAVSRQALPPWFLLVGFARYLWVLTLALRRRLGGRVVSISGTASGRFLAGAMMGLLTAALAPAVSRQRLAIAAVVFAVPFLAGFARDWLRAADIVPESSSLYRGAARIGRLVLDWLPLPLRAASAAALAALAWASAPLMAAPALALLLGAAGRAAALALVLLSALRLIPLDGAALAGVLSLLILGTGRWSVWSPERRLFARNAG